MSVTRSTDELRSALDGGTKRALAAAMAQRVLELEALVNSQSGTIAELTERLEEAGTRLGRYWDTSVVGEFGLAEPVRHRHCRGR